MADIPKTVRVDRTEGDPFELLERVRTGGMGTIHRAKDRTTGRTLAVKILKDASDAARFALEATVLQKLSHPAIVEHAYHGVTKEGDPYLAMEWVDGESLEDLLRKKGKLEEDEVIRIALSVCDALGAAHEAGVVHRDIKPSNVLLTTFGAVKVVDFGIAKSDVDLTETGAALGTVGYLAPEQARGGTVDARTDLFALGCLIFRALAGRRPFGGGDLMAYATELALNAAPRLHDVDASFDPALDALVSRLLQKDPNARPESAKVVHDQLLRMLDEGDATQPAPTVGRSSSDEAVPATRQSGPDLGLTSSEPTINVADAPTVKRKKKPVWPAIVGVFVVGIVAVKYTIPHASKSGTTFVEGENWFGTYTCDDGEHQLSLRITQGDDKGDVQAVFDFKTPKGSTGKYNAAGAYDRASRHLTLKAGTWITQPDLVVSVGLDGEVTEDDRLYSGKAVNPKCTTFKVRR